MDAGHDDADAAFRCVHSPWVTSHRGPAKSTVAGHHPGSSASATTSTTKSMNTKTRFTFYKDDDRQWRWRAKRSGRIVGDSGEGYHNRKDCELGLANLLASVIVNNYSVTRPITKLFSRAGRGLGRGCNAPSSRRKRARVAV